jgi:hypothetical protein
MASTRAMLPCVEGGGAPAERSPRRSGVACSVPILHDSKLRRAPFAATVAHSPAPPPRCANQTAAKSNGC